MIIAVMDEKPVEVKFPDQMAYPPEGGPALLPYTEETNRIILTQIDLAMATECSAREIGVTQRHPGMREVSADLLNMVGQSALRSQITGAHGGVFIINLMLRGSTEIDMHPSNLILIARELGVPLYVARDMLDAVSVTVCLVATSSGPLADESETDSVKASVSEFVEFLDSIDTDCFAESHGDVEDKRSDGEADGGADSAPDGDR